MKPVVHLLAGLPGSGKSTHARDWRRTASHDIMAVQARCAMLTGHRILCLVQSNDPNITFEPVGAAPVSWNHAEWFDDQRQPGSAPHRLFTE